MPEPPRGAQAWIEEVRGARVQSLRALAGGAGARRYWRLQLDDGSRAVLMHALAEDAEILPPALRATRDALPFLEVGELLARHAVPVPDVYAARRQERWVLLEDLGSIHLADLSADERARRHGEAIDLLARIHEIPRSDALPFRRRFDREWVGFELGLFLELVEPKPLRRTLEREFAELADAIAALPSCLCLRDYQSHNLMIDPAGRLRVIDYQDALLAPPELDLVALLWDSYVAIAPARRTALLERYAALRGLAPAPDALALLGVQRKAKDYSRFERMVQVKADARFSDAHANARTALLEHIEALPRGQSRLGRALRDALESLDS